MRVAAAHGSTYLKIESVIVGITAIVIGRLFCFGDRQICHGVNSELLLAGRDEVPIHMRGWKGVRGWVELPQGNYVSELICIIRKVL